MDINQRFTKDLAELNATLNKLQALCDFFRMNDKWKTDADYAANVGYLTKNLESVAASLQNLHRLFTCLFRAANRPEEAGSYKSGYSPFNGLREKVNALIKRLPISFGRDRRAYWDGNRRALADELARNINTIFNGELTAHFNESLMGATKNKIVFQRFHAR